MQEKLGELAQVHPECEEAMSIVENFAPVPQTGQISCYEYDDEKDLWIELEECPGTTGQDGDLLEGVEWSPADRFTDNNNGTVTDNLTGLVWLQDANCGDLMGWDDALTFANFLYDDPYNGNDCGLTDGSEAGYWHLPNIRELHSLVDFGKVRTENDPNVLPAEHPFTNVAPSFYWSSTTCAYYTGIAWDVSMYSGFVGSYGKDSNHYVWPVRSDNDRLFDYLSHLII